jgi:hypothetical protein
MGITSEVSAVIQTTKEQFEKAMTTSLTVDVLKNIVLRSVPFETSEMEKINDPNFRESFNKILNPITQNIMDRYQSVGQFDTGNLFTSMVTSIADSVSLESAYRAASLESKFIFDKIPVTPSREWTGEIYNAFESLKFTNDDIKSRFNQDLKFILSMEAGDDTIEKIKKEVKQSIDEAESKNELVEGTLEEIANYKKETAPPDDEYLDAENPEDQAKNGGSEEGEIEPGDEEGEGGSEDEEGGDENSQEEDDEDDEDDGADDPDAVDDEEGGGLGDDNTGLDEDDSSSEETGGDTGDSGDTDDLNGADEGGDLENAGEGDDGPGANGETDINASSTEPIDNPPVNASVDTGGKKANVIININAGGESASPVKSTESFTAKALKKAKEGLLLHTAESFASSFIPVHPRHLNNMTLPDKYDMASEAINAIGDVKKEIDIRLAGSKLALDKGNLSKEDSDILYEKHKKLSSISKEALDLAGIWNNAMIKLGITQNGLVNSQENTLYIARNIIARFLTKTKTPNAVPLPYTSKENVLSNAFDIIQLRHILKKLPNPPKTALDDLVSRESVFYRDIININDEDIKEKAIAVVDLSDMKIEKAVTVNFITDYKIKAWEQNVGKGQKDTNAEVVSRIENRFEELWGRKLNSDEKLIVDAITNERDATEIVSGPYEKFLITLSKESAFDKGVENKTAIEPLTTEENADNRFKAKIFTTILKSLEHFDLVDKYDLMEVDKFYNSTNPSLLHLGKSTESGKTINKNNLLKDSDIPQLEKLLGVKIGPQLKKYILTYGGGTGNSEIEILSAYKKDGKILGSMIESTKFLHTNDKTSLKYIVISEDGYGNSILINSSDQIFEHIHDKTPSIENMSKEFDDYIKGDLKKK